METIEAEKAKKAKKKEPMAKAELVVQPLPGDPSTFLTLALEKGADMATLERLEQMMERYTQRLAKRDYLTSLSIFQTLCPVITKDKTANYQAANGEWITYKWASLGQIDKEIKSLLQDTGLSKSYRIKQDGNTISVTCVISHANGHSEEVTMTAPNDDSGKKNQVQSRGSTVTYLKRYTLEGALGLTTTDNDPDGQRPKSADNPTITEAEVVVDKTKTDKPMEPMNEAQFNKTLESIKDGTLKIKELTKHYKLTADQTATIREAYYKRCIVLVSKGEMPIEKVQKEIKLTEDELSALKAVEPKKR